MFSVDAEHHERRSLCSQRQLMPGCDLVSEPQPRLTGRKSPKFFCFFLSWHDYVENAQMLPQRVAVDNQVAVLSILLQ